MKNGDRPASDTTVLIIEDHQPNLLMLKGYLIKPFRGQKLLDMVSDALERRRS